MCTLYIHCFDFNVLFLYLNFASGAQRPKHGRVRVNEKMWKIRRVCIHYNSICFTFHTIQWQSMRFDIFSADRLMWIRYIETETDLFHFPEGTPARSWESTRNSLPTLRAFPETDLFNIQHSISFLGICSHSPPFQQSPPLPINHKLQTLSETFEKWKLSSLKLRVICPLIWISHYERFNSLVIVFFVVINNKKNIGWHWRRVEVCLVIEFIEHKYEVVSKKEITIFYTHFTKFACYFPF